MKRLNKNMKWTQIFLMSIAIFISACDSTNDNSTTITPDAIQKGQNFVNFETGQVRPLAISLDGNTLFAVNTPNNTLDIFDINQNGLSFNMSIAVGMEPTAVAVLSNSQVWVVNHLSDSISVVDVGQTPSIIQTLLVGDEPRDIIFAGEGNKFAFVTTAHRGQNGANDEMIDAQLTTPGIGRADVWVFETNNTGSSIGGDPVTVINLFGDTPRALAKSPDGNTVYASVFFSGNKTTTLGEDNFSKPGPTDNVNGTSAPDTGLIVQHNGTNWVDATGSASTLSNITYDSKVPFSLPDYDIFSIDASIAVPVEKTNMKFSGVGTTLFNMLTHPVSGKIYVSNTHALNVTRFEGPGTFAGTLNSTSPENNTVRGHFVESRISIANADDQMVTSVHLNKHIDYSQSTGTSTERELAVSQPVDMAITADGKFIYIASFGTQKIVIYDTEKLENNTFTASNDSQILLSAGGPSGVVINSDNSKLYVLTRFDNGISIIDTTNNTETSHVTMHNPESDAIVAGRSFLYDATNTSSHGDSSCGLCHVYGDFDGLAWDLGNPDEVVVTNPNDFISTFLKPETPEFHPMKGPMTTQSFRGLKGNGPMHWRGDRVGASATEGESIELGAFKDFNVAFPGLVGSDNELATDDMQAFAKFALTLTYPPNPIRALDNSLTTRQQQGKDIYLNEGTTASGTLKCNDCHVVDIANNNFGTSGKSSIEGSKISQEFKIPHLRNMYQKIGKFGNSGKFSTDTDAYGPQIKGFGFMHDGGMDTLNKFLLGEVFTDAQNNQLSVSVRDKLVSFVMAMDSELLPIVGQQITLSKASGNDIINRISLLQTQAKITEPRAECDLIVKGNINSIQRGYLYQADGKYQSDIKSESLSEEDLLKLVNENNQTLTFTCVPPGSGMWMGIDRDEDGEFDQDEILTGTNPLEAQL